MSTYKIVFWENRCSLCTQTIHKDRTLWSILLNIKDGNGPYLLIQKIKRFSPMKKWRPIWTFMSNPERRHHPPYAEWNAQCRNQMRWKIKTSPHHQFTIITNSFITADTSHNKIFSRFIFANTNKQIFLKSAFRSSVVCCDNSPAFRNRAYNSSFMLVLILLLVFCVWVSVLATCCYEIIHCRRTDCLSVYSERPHKGTSQVDTYVCNKSTTRTN